jgi:FkbM family methyltransferase
MRRVRGGVAAGLWIDTTCSSAAYAAGTNELPVQLALADALRPGDAFLDVGANVGFFSFLAARLVGVSGSVHALEPVPVNAERIRAGARRNRLSQVEVHEVAAASSSGTATLLLAEHPGGAVIASAGAPPDPAGELRVTTVTVDALVAGGVVPSPHVVKIDVEGAELDVLEGMTSVLALGRATVLCEVDAGDDDRLAVKERAVSDHLRSFGCSVERLPPSYAGPWRVAHLVARPGARR